MEQIRFCDLLARDRLFKAWFLKPPTIKVFHSTPPWRLYVQATQGGPWARVDTPTYTKAFKALRLRLPEAWDMTIHSKGQRFKPPLIRVNKTRLVYIPVPDGHLWCVYCRRPTVFKYFARHPALKVVCPNDEPRCCICGIRASAMEKFKTPLVWEVVNGSPATVS